MPVPIAARSAMGNLRDVGRRKCVGENREDMHGVLSW